MVILEPSIPGKKIEILKHLYSPDANSIHCNLFLWGGGTLKIFQKLKTICFEKVKYIIKTSMTSCLKIVRDEFWSVFQVMVEKSAGKKKKKKRIDYDVGDFSKSKYIQCLFLVSFRFSTHLAHMASSIQN